MFEGGLRAEDRKDQVLFNAAMDRP
jgi:hypothetical protein